MRDKILTDLFADPLEEQDTNNTPKYHSIFFARLDRELKGANGFILELGQNFKGFIKKTKNLKIGDQLCVQCVNTPDKGKLALFSTDILLKDKYFIFKVNDSKISLSKSISTNQRILSLKENVIEKIIAEGLMGVILRGSLKNLTDAEIVEELNLSLAKYKGLMKHSNSRPNMIFEGNNAKDRAIAEWSFVTDDNIINTKGCFESYGLWEHIFKLTEEVVQLSGGGNMIIEQTTTLVSIDINTASNTDKNAAIEANRQAMIELPRQLRMRGLGGLIYIDFAPLAKLDRQQIVSVLIRHLLDDPVKTQIVGWTPAGNLELNRKKERIRVESWLEKKSV